MVQQNLCPKCLKSHKSICKLGTFHLFWRCFSPVSVHLEKEWANKSHIQRDSLPFDLENSALPRVLHDTHLRLPKTFSQSYTAVNDLVSTYLEWI